MSTIDLHMHSTESDGSLSPELLMERAARLGLKTVALTDHDTVSGLHRAAARAEGLGMEFIPGIEISTHFEPGTMHILGYFFDPEHPLLNEKLKDIQRARQERNPRIIEKLRAAGVDIDYEEVIRASGGGQVGRPHFAKVLVAKGVVRSSDEAFEKYLKKGAAAYVEKWRITPEEAVNFIAKAGGVASVAHPKLLELSGYDAIEELLTRLKEAGLGGLEVYHSSHHSAAAKNLRKIAERLDLVATGGSDYHGDSKKYAELGTLGAGKQLDYTVVEELRRRARGRKG